MSGGLFLTLGTVLFRSLEIPQDFGPLGGDQVIVKHKFPGGFISETTLGAFPPDQIKWSGILTGSFAFIRAQQIDRMRVLGSTVVLRYGPFAWSGKVAYFRPMAKHQWLVPYEIMFEPIADLSGIGFLFGLLESAEQALFGQDTAFDSVVAGASGLALPASLSGPAANVDTSLAVGLADGGGTVAGIPTSDVQTIDTSLAAVQTTAAPLIAGQDATQASPALDLSARAAAIGAVVASPRAPVRVLLLINPNLFTLAAQYLGDPTKWQDIAAASGLSDPQPVGQFTITIPAT